MEKHEWHWVIKVLILVVVFWIGVKVGELKMLVKEAVYGPQIYGGYMMRGGYGMMNGMMNGWDWYGSATSTKRQ